MAKIYTISKPNDCLIDTIFIHGLNGDAFATWQHTPDKYDSWPYWLASRRPNIGVHCVQYDSPILGKSPSALSISQLLISEMVRNDIGQRPVVFVCHSTGGFIAKSILRLATDSIELACSNVAHNLRAVMFLSTPHRGAKLIDIAYKVGLGLYSEHTRSLVSNDSYFSYVSEWYSIHAPKFGIISRDYNGINSSILSNQEVSLGHNSLTVVDADHVSLSKPSSRQNTVCTDLEQLIDNVLFKLNVPSSQRPRSLNRSHGEDTNSDVETIPLNLETENKNVLVVFVHGLGANASEFWGSTPTAVTTHPEMRNAVVRFWGYETSLRPTPWYRQIMIRLNIGRRTQSIAQLGEHLWSDLRLWIEEDGCKVVKLIGHSMGGVVVASAVAHGLGKGAKHRNLIDSLKGVALIATPLAGADLANKAAPIFRIFGKNVHIADLRANSTSRREIITAFVHELLKKNDIGLAIFRAANDGVVIQKELTEPLRGLRFDEEVLAGAHSECVQNLDAGTPNLRKLIRWIQEKPKGASDDRPL